MQPLTIHTRVVAAMLLREARVKYGRTRLGYLWAIVEPVFYVATLSLLFTSFMRNAPHGESFALFFATGVLPFQFYRNLTNHVGAAFEANKPLFNYPIVKHIDAAIARTILETATTIVAMTIIFGFLIPVLGVHGPQSLPKLLLAVSLMTLFGFGSGLTNAVIRRKFPAWANLYHVFMGPSFFISGVFFSMQSVPTYYRELLAWNPIIHGVEGFRDGYYSGYRNPDLDLMYLFWWAITLTFIGLVSERVTRKVSP